MNKLNRGQACCVVLLYCLQFMDCLLIVGKKRGGACCFVDCLVIKRRSGLFVILCICVFFVF